MRKMKLQPRNIILPDKSAACVDGMECHVAGVNHGVPRCHNGCAIRRAMSAWTWPNIVGLANAGHNNCARVVERASNQTP